MNAEEKMLKYVRFSILQILFVILFGFGLSVVFIKMALQEMLTGSSVFTFLLFFFFHGSRLWYICIYTILVIWSNDKIS